MHPEFSEIEYRQVKIAGNYIHDKEIHLFMGAQSVRGPSGYHILTPFKLTAESPWV